MRQLVLVCSVPGRARLLSLYRRPLCPGWMEHDQGEKQWLLFQVTWPWAHQSLLDIVYSKQDLFPCMWGHWGFWPQYRSFSQISDSKSKAPGTAWLLWHFGTDQSRILLQFVGSVCTPSADATCPRNLTAVWNSLHFYGFSFKPALRMRSSTSFNQVACFSGVLPNIRTSSR